ncbi:ATP-dependent Clp protease proteolytic subunit-like [Ylistrum balloti]|uniref:ATP-dependent Clp protease proteolytic subunit-like n=1 Tax=Ylistrum balloti TaxID=509963 RepID=UPI002905D5ED|nr:ATP-dependent Clp protease proteolytic subunit-like [Ylistrum balloti]
MIASFLKKATVPLCQHGRSFVQSLTSCRKLHQLPVVNLANAPSITETADRGKPIDVFTRLMRDRIICLMGTVTDDVAEKVMAQLLCLHFEDPEKLIRVFINSPGGKVSAGLAIYDTMQYINNPIATLCIGEACSMGSLLLTAGTTGMRYASPNSTIMVHQPLTTGLQGYVTDLKIKAANMKKTKELIQELYVKHTGLTPLVIEKALDRDNYMTPLEAKEFGLIDEIL